MRALLVKLTSMGDLMHALPAITDATTHNPELTFDWVIDKNFSEVAQWHPAVKKIIPTSHRKWRKHIWQSLKNHEIQNFVKSLRQERYDVVIDGQTSMKSAVTTLLSKGPRHGFDAQSAREPIAHLAYQHRHSADKSLHAIKRLRLLFSQAFQYPYIDDSPNYGVAAYQFPELPFTLPKSYVVFVHNASWESKMWPERYWRQLIQLAAMDGLSVVLPWGNEQERQRATRIQENLSNAMVLPFCTLSQHARILKDSEGAVCSDTGLAHLAAVLNVPAITLYGSTNEGLIGTTGLHQSHIVSTFPCTKCYKTECTYQNIPQSEPLCLTSIQPNQIWSLFQSMR